MRSHLGFFYYSKVKFTIVSVFFDVTGFSHFTKVNGSSSLLHWQRRQDKRKVYHSIKSSWIAFVYQKFIKRCFFSWPPSIAPALGTCLQSNIHPENEDNLLKVSFQTEKQAYNKYPFQKGVEQKKNKQTQIHEIFFCIQELFFKHRIPFLLVFVFQYFTTRKIWNLGEIGKEKVTFHCHSHHLRYAI